MSTWIQNTTATYTDGTVKEYGPTRRDADRMIGFLAQVTFLRQAGEDIELHQETDDNFHPIRYIILRHLKDREIVATFDRQ